MNKLIDLIKSIYKIKELRERILFTLTLLLVYRLGAQVVLPGVDSLALSDLSSRSDGGGLLGILNAFTGGAFANASIFALGIMPYISASIVVQLMGVALPYLQKLQKEGESGRKKNYSDYQVVNYLYMCSPSSSLFIWFKCSWCS
jgi:preprotein translocase subunit SecY